MASTDPLDSSTEFKPGLPQHDPGNLRENVEKSPPTSGATLVSQNPSTAEKYANLVIESHDLGVWRFFIAWERPKRHLDIKRHIRSVARLRSGSLTTVFRALKEVYSVAPVLSIALAGLVAAGGLGSAVSMASSAHVFHTVSLSGPHIVNSSAC